MGRSENLPEVVPQPPAPLPEYDTGPQVVSDQDSSDHQRDIDSQRDKYPAPYDTAPKLPCDSPVSAESTYQQRWLDQQHQQNWLLAPGTGHPVSALSPANTSVPWSSIHPGSVYHGDGYSSIGDAQKLPPPPPPPEEKTICGIPRRIFAALVIFSIIVIAAAVGGGVGGALKARQGEQNTESPAQSGSSGSASSSNLGSTPTKSSPGSSKTSAAPKPSITSLFNQTVIKDGFAFQAYSGVNGTGNSTKIYTEEGFFDFAFKARSYMWQPGKTDCCLTFCANATATESLGWWCDARKRNETPVAFPRVNIWCGRWTNTEQRDICKKPIPQL